MNTRVKQGLGMMGKEDLYIKLSTALTFIQLYISLSLWIDIPYLVGIFTAQHMSGIPFSWQACLLANMSLLLDLIGD